MGNESEQWQKTNLETSHPGIFHPRHAYQQAETRTITVGARLQKSLESDKKTHQVGTKTITTMKNNRAP